MTWYWHPKVPNSCNSPFQDPNAKLFLNIASLLVFTMVIKHYLRNNGLLWIITKYDKKMKFPNLSNDFSLRINILSDTDILATITNTNRPFSASSKIARFHLQLDFAEFFGNIAFRGQQWRQINILLVQKQQWHDQLQPSTAPKWRNNFNSLQIPKESRISV